MINNRQNGRRRGRGGQRTQGGSSQGSRDNGNRIDSRARGNASQLLEKYKNLASDAQRQGDRVNTEYYLQFADHYFRVLADQRGRYEDQGQQQRRPQNDFDADEDYGDEGEPIRADEQGRAGEDRGERDGRQQDGNRGYDRDRQQDGNRTRSDRDSRSDRDLRSDRDTRSDRDSRSDRYDAQRGEGGDTRQRDGQERTSRQSSARRDERANGQPTGDVPAVAAAQPHAAAPVQAAETPSADAQVPPESDGAAAPKRRGRPRKVSVEAGDQLGLDVSALPPAIAGESAAEEAAPKPRRRRSSAAVPAEADA